MSKKFSGLTGEEVTKRLAEFGSNELKDFHSLSPFRIIFRQIKKNFIIYLLCAAALISFVVGKPITGYVVLAVTFLVIFVSFIQEYRAEKAIKALRGMLMPVSIIIRDGRQQELDSRQLVPGDIVILRSGERVPADCLLLEEKNLLVNESILTGESKEIKKEVVQDNQHYGEENILFMGSYVVGGRCIAQVIHTGMNTKFGGVASMISQAEKQLPLQEKVNHIARYMVIAAILISVSTGFFMITRAAPLNYEALTNILILVIALSVSAFPEGLPVVLVTTLAVGASRMARKNAIVNRMSIIETLGETTVICTDKTGTITTGEMTVKKVFVAEKIYSVSGVGFKAEGEFLSGEQKIDVEKESSLRQLLLAAVLCNDSQIERTGEDQEYKILGTPTEGALLILAAKAKVFKEDLSYTREEEIPFSSERKMMSVLCKEGDDQIVFAKGAPEVILEKAVGLTAEEKKKILTVSYDMANNSYRFLALAFKKVDNADKNYSEEKLTFLGLVGMEDPPREEVKEAIEESFKAGIAVKMITGDGKETALSVAREVGLLGEVLEGADLDNMTDDELGRVIKHTVVFARVRPEHKLRIVKVLKTNGEVVTMTGDGVNDAPALKEAHIGVAMGKNGTDVSRSVSDLTLKDDNFATIVIAVREGRTIFNNIRKFVSYQLSCNYAELMILFFGVLLAPLLGWQVPLLLALQILFMNLVTDDLPAITLSFNPTSSDVMTEKPRRKSEILNKQLFMLTLFTGILMAFLTLVVFFISFNIFKQSLEVSRTTALISLILLEIANAFNFRSFRRKVLSRSPWTNIYLVYASIISLVATLLIIYTPLSLIFETVPVSVGSWALALLSPAILLAVFDTLKESSNKRVRFFTEKFFATEDMKALAQS